MDNHTPDPDGQSLHRAALRLLSPFEKDKLICMLLHGDMTFTDVNWEALATTLGSKDGHTMFEQINKIMKKIEDGAVTLPEGDGLRTAYRAKRKRPKKTAADAATEGAAPQSSLTENSLPGSSLRAGDVGKGDATSDEAEPKNKRAKRGRGKSTAKKQNKPGETVSKSGKERSDEAQDGRENGINGNGLASVTTDKNDGGDVEAQTTARSREVVTIDL